MSDTRGYIRALDEAEARLAAVREACDREIGSLERELDVAREQLATLKRGLTPDGRDVAIPFLDAYLDHFKGLLKEIEDLRAAGLVLERERDDERRCSDDLRGMITRKEALIDTEREVSALLADALNREQRARDRDVETARVFLDADAAYRLADLQLRDGNERCDRLYQRWLTERTPEVQRDRQAALHECARLGEVASARRRERVAAKLALDQLVESAGTREEGR